MVAPDIFMQDISISLSVVSVFDTEAILQLIGTIGETR